MTHWKPTVQLLQRLRSRKGRREQNAFSIEGYRLLERALESQAPLRHVLCSQQLYECPNPRTEALLRQLEAIQCPVSIAPDASLQEFIEGRTFGSLMGIVETLPSFELVTQTRSMDTPVKLLILVDVMDPGNLGAMARTAMASGVDGLISIGGTDLFHPKSVRTSMGALFDLPTLQVDRRAIQSDVLQVLKQQHIQSIGAVVRNGVSPHTTETITHRTALFMGSEAHGLPHAVQEELDVHWRIPMPAQIDSFSVNAATSVLLYEINRRMWSS